MSFISVRKGEFIKDGKSYRVAGANYWQGMNLGASECLGGNRERLLEELDHLQSMGINQLRILGGSEGPDRLEQRIRPSLQPEPGVYHPAVLEGLDYFLHALGKRGMTAVVVLNNFWSWSGGFAQYLNWATGEPIPEQEGFTAYAERFYTNSTANALFKAHIRFLQNHVNPFNGQRYRECPTIMSWQIANEPYLGPKAWFFEISNFIKAGASHQLVSAGIESKLDRTDFMNAHANPSIDYCTHHCWVENWGYYDPNKPGLSSLEIAETFTQKMIDQTVEWAQEIEKPLVLEEFGMARDAWLRPKEPEYKYDPSTPTSHKDRYYQSVFNHVLAWARQGSHSGAYFWVYGGLGRSTDKPNSFGMVWLGDPPHEPKGWYSVYNQDTTVRVIQEFTRQILV